MAGKVHYVLAGAAAGLQDVAGSTGEEFFQYRPDRHMVAMERRRIEPAVGLDRPAILAKLNHKLGHRHSPVRPILDGAGEARKLVGAGEARKK